MFTMSFLELIALLCIIQILLFILFLIIIWHLDCDFTLSLCERFGKSLSNYAGKVVWITGASSGIGEHLAYVIARNGGKIALSARREPELQRVRQKCLDIGKEAGLKPEDIFVVPMDITDIQSHQSHLQKVLDHFGKLDILVNNAGRSQRAQWESIDIRVDKELFELNVFSLVALTRQVLAYFMEQKRGHVVVNSSVAGKFGVPFSASYTASKHALHGYFEGLRSEKAAVGIDVTMLVPGPVFSSLLENCFTEKPGQVFGTSMQATDKRMTTERCAHLSAVAIINKLDEAWIALNPVLACVYGCQYLPSISRKLLIAKGSKALLKVRDSRDTLSKEE